MFIINAFISALVELDLVGSPGGSFISHSISSGDDCEEFALSPAPPAPSIDSEEQESSSEAVHKMMKYRRKLEALIAKKKLPRDYCQLLFRYINKPYEEEFLLHCQRLMDQYTNGESSKLSDNDNDNDTN